MMFLASPSEPSPTSPILPDLLLDTFFSRLHGKPYYILDEVVTRQKHQLGQLPPHLSMAIAAVSSRYDYFNAPKCRKCRLI